jgi:Gamma-glutamyltranspeptidase
MADSVRSATPTLPTTTSTLVSLIREPTPPGARRTMAYFYPYLSCTRSTLADGMAWMPGLQAGWQTYKREVIASGAVVASNHPLASAAGIEVLSSGGNAVDAAVATLVALSVVEPMMVSPFGAGFFLIRDGRSGEVVFIDNYATVPAAATPDMYQPIAGSLDYETVGAANSVGYRAVATPGALKGWAHAVERYGRLPLATLVEPAIRFATAGFAASAYLVNVIHTSAEAIARFPATAVVFLPGGRPPVSARSSSEVTTPARCGRSPTRAPRRCTPAGWRGWSSPTCRPTAG